MSLKAKKTSKEETSPRKDKSPRLGASMTLRQTIPGIKKAGMKREFDMDDIRDMIKNCDPEDLFPGLWPDKYNTTGEGNKNIPCTVVVAEECMFCYTDTSSGMVLEPQMVALIPYFQLKHYHTNLTENSISIAHESPFGKDPYHPKSNPVPVLTIFGLDEERFWGNEAVFKVDRKVLQYMKVESRKAKTFVDFLGLSNSPDQDVLLMDTKAEREQGAVSAAESQIYGTRFLGSWVLRPELKTVKLSTDSKINVLFVPSASGIVMLIPALGAMEVLYWKEVYSHGGKGKDVFIDHRSNSNEKFSLKFIYNFPFAKQGELIDQVLIGVLDQAVKKETKIPAFPKLYPPKKIVNGLHDADTAKAVNRRFTQVKMDRGRRLSVMVQNTPELKRKAKGKDEGKTERSRFTVNFLSNALDIQNMDAEEDSEAVVIEENGNETEGYVV